MTTDARKPEARRFYRARRAEVSYAKQLRSIAAHIGRLVRQMRPSTPAGAARVERILRAYSERLEPWARAAASRMLADMARRDEAAWAELAKSLRREVHKEIHYTPIAERMRELLERQVILIKSLPLEAAERVHHLVLEGMEGSRRPAEIAAEIMRSGDVTKSRATLIARTEVGRAATTLVQARAEFVGSTHYRWQTAMDADVRPSHRRMQGRVVPWNKPPTLDNLTGHAGQLPNCRCFPQVIIPEER